MTHMQPEVPFLKKPPLKIRSDLVKNWSYVRTDQIIKKEYSFTLQGSVDVGGTRSKRKIQDENLCLPPPRNRTSNTSTGPV